MKKVRTEIDSTNSNTNNTNENVREENNENNDEDIIITHRSLRPRFNLDFKRFFK